MLLKTEYNSWKKCESMAELISVQNEIVRVYFNRSTTTVIINRE